MDLSSLMLGAPTDLAGFERELMAMTTTEQMALVAPLTAADVRDVEELIADALKRRCNYNNGRKAALQMHLRLKNGANADTLAMTRCELAELAELVAAKGAANAIAQRLANFYVRIAMLRARIEAILRSSSAADPAANPSNPGNPANPGNPVVQGNGNGKYEQQLLAAYAKNEESLREKRHQNQRELDRIMRALGDITEADLPALETQVEHIAERGCIAQELRRVKIVEALLEQQRLDALLSQLHM